MPNTVLISIFMRNLSFTVSLSFCSRPVEQTTDSSVCRGAEYALLSRAYSVWPKGHIFLFQKTSMTQGHLGSSLPFFFLLSSKKTIVIVQVVLLVLYFSLVTSEDVRDGEGRGV